MRGEIRRRDAAGPQPAQRADDQERQVGRDVPEMRNAKQHALVRETVEGGILRDRGKQEHADDRRGGHDREYEHPQDCPATS